MAHSANVMCHLTVQWRQVSSDPSFRESHQPTPPNRAGQHGQPEVDHPLNGRQRQSGFRQRSAGTIFR